MNKKGPQFGELTWPGSDRWEEQAWVRTMNKVLAKLRLPLAVKKHFNHRETMVSLEQAANLHLLLTQVLELNVPGEVVELGCYTGATTSVIAGSLKQAGSNKAFHVYDSFGFELGSERGIREIFESNLRESGHALPRIHAGDIFQTVPAELPDRIAFAHLDLGVGGSTDGHRSLIGYALDALYPRLAPHAVLVLMDYHVPGITVAGNDSNPGVRVAADTFFSDKKEKPITLYGGPCSHAYVRKQAGT